MSKKIAFNITNEDDLQNLKKSLIEEFPELEEAVVSPGFRSGSISFPKIEIPHYRSVLTSALQKSVRRQMPNQAEKALVLLLFLLTHGKERDRKAILTMTKKRLLIIAVEDVFCFVNGPNLVVKSWGEEGEVRPNELRTCIRELASNGTCRYPNKLKRDSENPAVRASYHDSSSRNWKSRVPSTFSTLMTMEDSDSLSILAIQKCILRMYKGKAQRLSKGRPVGDFKMLLVAIFLLRKGVTFEKEEKEGKELVKSNDELKKLSHTFHKSVYDEHSGVRLVRYIGCGNVTVNKFKCLQKI